jgi:hypothetical protein
MDLSPEIAAPTDPHALRVAQKPPLVDECEAFASDQHGFVRAFTDTFVLLVEIMLGVRVPASALT